MNFVVGDIVVFKDHGVIGYGIVEVINNDAVIGNVTVRDLNRKWCTSVWGSNVKKLDETAYNDRRNELLEQLDQLDAAFKSVGETK